MAMLTHGETLRHLGSSDSKVSMPRLKVAAADLTEPRPIIRSDHPLLVVRSWYIVGDPEVMRA